MTGRNVTASVGGTGQGHLSGDLPSGRFVSLPFLCPELMCGFFFFLFPLSPVYFCEDGGESIGKLQRWEFQL